MEGNGREGNTTYPLPAADAAERGQDVEASRRSDAEDHALSLLTTDLLLDREEAGRLLAAFSQCDPPRHPGYVVKALTSGSPEAREETVIRWAADYLAINVT